MNKEKIAIFLLIITLTFLYSCKSKDPTSPDIYPDLTERLESKNFVYHFAPGDYVDPPRQEAFHRWAIVQLGVTCPKKIDLYKFKNVSHMKYLTGRPYSKYTTAWADPDNFAIYTIWSWENHECVHCYTSLIGRPSDFFNEGIAITYQVDPYNNVYEPQWCRHSDNSQPLHKFVKKLKREGKLIPLDDILESDAFRNNDLLIDYPESGSFVKFMIDSYGSETMKYFFRLGNRNDSKAIIKTNFRSVYGFSIVKAEKEWLEFLDNY